ncbi:MAG: glycoside hydrolase family 3 C-terminal domain-containing protein [Rhizobiaceae bacterium]
MPATIESLVDAMSLEEQVALLSGQDFWSVAPNERLGIGTLRVTDGPNGARGGGSLIGGVKSASFPVGISIGASWNPALAEEIGAALADEVKSKGAHVSLAPTVNIHRTVTNGRNFECYSEDPLLTGTLAAGYVKGMQQHGISATIKHYAGNESEIKRTTNSSEIDERSLREIYLVPFEMAVKQGGTWGIMSSYNKINGTYAAENHWLLTEVLRDDWGYDGIVMSDWFGSRSTAPTVNAGMDLEMPGPTRDRGAKLVAAVEVGEVSAETVRTRALNMLRLMQRTGALSDHRPHTEVANDRPEHRELIRRAGAEGTVLLKNSGILPLDKAKAQTIALIGPNAKVAQIMGGGSAQLNPHYRVSPWDGLVNALGTDKSLSFAHGSDNNRFQPLLEGAFRIDYFANKDLAGEPVHTETITNLQSFMIGMIGAGLVDPANYSLRATGSFTAIEGGAHRAGVFATGPMRLLVDGKIVADGWSNWTAGQTFFEEGCDEITGDLMLAAGKTYEVVFEYCTKKSENLTFTAFQAGLGKPSTKADINSAAEAAAKADIAILCVGRNGEWDTEGWDLPDIMLPGMQNELIEAVAAANPNTIVVLQTGGPIEMPWLDNVSAVFQSWYPGQEAGNAISDVLFGDAEPGGRLPQTFPVRWSDNPAQSQDPEVYPGHNGKVRYEEGLFIGHKHYDKTGIQPLFPFGFGLSYTQFEWTNFRITPQGNDFIAEIDVTNTGSRAGSEVVQIYVEDKTPILPRPLRELKGFAKLHLGAGETGTARVVLSPRSFATFDVKSKHWIARSGAFTICAARNAAEMIAKADIMRKEEWRAKP